MPHTSAHPTNPNRLAQETSPYLLQHTSNPVAWWPWSPEAIEHARSLDVPVFLSIGYATCYWCHVMERESFENDETASLMNEHFVSIKVDREEHPDIDNIYMMALQALTGRGGWPMSMFLDPHTLRPIYGGTYFPKEPRHGLPSFEQVLSGVARAWREQRTQLEEHGAAIEQSLKKELATPRATAPLDFDIAVNAVRQLLNAHDHANGGFGQTPKFPQPTYLSFLLEMRGHVDGALCAQIDEVLTLTLDRMATGGIFDQVGGGFHRYATDAKWMIPHFEKMLYDNALLSMVYLDGSEAYADSFYRDVAHRTLAYVLREMTTTEGTFASAQDAEVEEREGLNYLWTESSVRAALEDASREDLIPVAMRAYGLDRGPNFQDPHHPDEPRSNVLFLIDRSEPLAEQMSLTREECTRRLRELNDILYASRARRKQPLRDDKVLSGWNGLMIAALARGGAMLDDESFLDASSRAATFLLSRMRDDEGGILRTYRNGESKLAGTLEDHAFVMWGLIELHRATSDPRWLDQAIAIHEVTEARFHDETNDGYFDTLANQPLTLIRTRTVYDGALPSGNSVMLHNLLDLHEQTRDAQYLEHAARALEANSGSIARAPTSTSLATAALARMTAAHPEHVPRQGELAEEARLAGLSSIATDPRTVRPSVDEPATLVVTLNVADGFHLNAHEPGDDDLIGLLIYMTGAEGVVVHPNYPPADVRGDGLCVYTGTVNIPLRIETTGSIEGTPQIMLRWQACTATECLAPQEVGLDVEIIPEAHTS